MVLSPPPSPNSRCSTEHDSVISPVPATTREIRGNAMTRQGWKGGDRSWVWQLTFEASLAVKSSGSCYCSDYSSATSIVCLCV